MIDKVRNSTHRQFSLNPARLSPILPSTGRRCEDDACLDMYRLGKLLCDHTLRVSILTPGHMRGELQAYPEAPPQEIDAGKKRHDACIWMCHGAHRLDCRQRIEEPA